MNGVSEGLCAMDIFLGGRYKPVLDRYPWKPPYQRPVAAWIGEGIIQFSDFTALSAEDPEHGAVDSLAVFERSFHRRFQ